MKLPKWLTVVLMLVLALFMLRVGAEIPALLVAAFAIFSPFIKEFFADLLYSENAEKKDYTKPVSHKEALEIFELDENASKEEIKEAYHRLMMKNHPDQGGSKYLASKINAARDVLLGKD